MFGRVTLMWWCRAENGRRTQHAVTNYMSELKYVSVNNGVNIILPSQRGPMKKSTRARCLCSLRSRRRRFREPIIKAYSLHGWSLAVCSKHREETFGIKGWEYFYDQICLSPGPVTWPASPAVMNSPYFTIKQMNAAWKRRKKWLGAFFSKGRGERRLIRRNLCEMLFFFFFWPYLASFLFINLTCES